MAIPPRPEELAIEVGLQVLACRAAQKRYIAEYFSFVPREEAVLRVESIKGIQKAGHLPEFC